MTDIKTYTLLKLISKINRIHTQPVGLLYYKLKYIGSPTIAYQFYTNITKTQLRTDRLFNYLSYKFVDLFIKNKGVTPIRLIYNYIYIQKYYKSLVQVIMHLRQCRNSRMLYIMDNEITSDFMYKKNITKKKHYKTSLQNYLLVHNINIVVNSSGIVINQHDVSTSVLLLNLDKMPLVLREVIIPLLVSPHQVH